MKLKCYTNECQETEIRFLLTAKTSKITHTKKKQFIFYLSCQPLERLQEISIKKIRKKSISVAFLITRYKCVVNLVDSNYLVDDKYFKGTNSKVRPEILFSFLNIIFTRLNFKTVLSQRNMRGPAFPTFSLPDITTQKRRRISPKREKGRILQIFFL